ncbi:type I-E CRISPR-associated protein Cse2/CasB [Frankia sp. CiP1_Cm_nod1]|uniref:type I-E CRISPR-associated protein Cse2/CasB n=1 Tax=Frankia sp. CiP1_Cm_nod1 TaxID=2897160 RepID=UPI002024E0DF
MTDVASAPPAEPTTPPVSSEKTRRQTFFWERAHNGDLPDGADLAALRRGIGREPGSVPAMWRYYTTLDREGRLTARLRAEHVALTLYAVHQQSLPSPAHRAGTGLGTAVLALRNSDRFSPDAVDRRFNAAATATSLDEAAYHLRGLVRQLRHIPQSLDYNQLQQDLINWQHPDRVGQVRRRWGGQYFLGRGRDGDRASTTSAR